MLSMVICTIPWAFIHYWKSLSEIKKQISLLIQTWDRNNFPVFSPTSYSRIQSSTIYAHRHKRRNFKYTNPLMSSSLVIFCLEWCSNFVGSESGQKQSVKLPQDMVHSTFQYPPIPPPQSHTVCIFCTWRGGEGEGGQRDGTVEGQQYTSKV
jgi:hypothetical protein